MAVPTTYVLLQTSNYIHSFTIEMCKTHRLQLITMPARLNEINRLRLDTGIVASNPTRIMHARAVL